MATYAMSPHNADVRVTVANILPPLFVCVLVGTIWSIHFSLHLLALLQAGVPNSEIDAVLHAKGVWQTLVSQFLTSMFAICFVRCILSHPGAPEGSEWSVESMKLAVSTQETKSSTGERRFCKWCHKYKPDRCHHCRICKSCVLKMDHHCPWIMNCVGFRNHKFFFLLVVYGVANCYFIIATMVESVQRSVNQDTPSMERFMLVLGMVLASIMAFLLTCFLSFHSWLMSKGMTTIEFCEKNLSSDQFRSKSPVSYDTGLYMNVKAVLGPHWWLWFLPVSPPEGNGFSFTSALNVPNTAKEYGSIKAEPLCIKAEPERTGKQDSTP